MAEKDQPTATLTDLDKLAIDAVIKRQQSLLDVMRHTDTRAQQLVAAYAGLAGAALLFGIKDGPLAENASLGASAVIVVLYVACLSYGCWQAVRACLPTNTALASRGPDFWEWARLPSNGPKFVTAFLAEAEVHAKHNEKVQARAARHLKHAMYSGVAALVLAATSPLVVIGLKLFKLVR